MVQVIHALVKGHVLCRTLPDPSEELLPGLLWGRADALFTPSFWAAQTWMFREERGGHKPDFRSGRTLPEEIAACLLGGHGIRGELSHAAFLRLREQGLLEGVPREDLLEAALREPLVIAGKPVRYRFPRVKASILASSLSQVRGESIPLNPHRAFRNSLLSLPGVGPKTASWITRNWLQSDCVAILDVHVQRAGEMLGIFSDRDRVQRDYFSMEERFLGFADLVGEPASILDLVIWRQMRRASSTVAQILGSSSRS